MTEKTEKNDLQANITNRRAYYQSRIDTARAAGNTKDREYWQDRLDLYMVGLADGYALATGYAMALRGDK